MKFFLGVLAVLLVALGLLYINGGEQHVEPHGGGTVTGLPWQIDRLPGGDSRVFGITLGKTTLGEAIDRMGDDLELAVIAPPHEAGTLEAYYSHYSAGPVTGRLILILDVDGDTLREWRSRAYQDGGTRRYLLHPDDLPVAYLAPVKVITFMPSLDLDEAIVRARFGEPAEVMTVADRQQHWLYPALGLDLVLNADGKDLLQYLSPRVFSAHRDYLRQPPASGG
jgi:hypothetical protein